MEHTILVKEKGATLMEYTTQTFVFSNGTARVHTPILTEEERARRHEALEKAAAKFLKHVVMVEAAGEKG